MTVSELIAAIYAVDLEILTDDDYADLETCLKHAVDGIERGLPLDPAKRPTPEELLAQMNEVFAKALPEFARKTSAGER